MPAVSILMVLHRDTPFLRPAIESALNQTWRDFELILVDNGTGISSAALGAIGSDPRLRWVRLPTNEGIPAGHNAGVAAATGEFVALLDYDDLAKPLRLERQVGALRSHRDVGLVSALAERIDADGRVSGQVFCLPRSEEHEVYSAYGGPVVLATALIRREVLVSLPYRKEFPFAADLDFQARAAERIRMLVMPEVHLSYRWYRAQTTQQRQRDIERSRSVIQLATARRRAGRDEGLAPVLAETATYTAAATWRHVGGICLREGHAEYAVFQARRSLACERSVASAVTAARIAWDALKRTHGPEQLRVARMFLRGPVRALRLNPVR